MKILLATSNKNKIREIREMTQGSGIEVLSPADLNISLDVEETGTTFAENAAIKAEALRDIAGLTVIADDSGLEIDFFDGGPGVYSSRFMGEDTSYDIKNSAILEKMKDVPEEKRGARFRCAMALARPGLETEIYEGTFEGIIGYEIKGENGFGYDPIFFVPERGMSSAEMTPEEKNAVSHRGTALRKTVKRLMELS